MQNNIAVTEAVRHLAIGAAGTTASLSIQLKTPHTFLNLQLPYWFFLLSMIVLVFVGAFLSLRIDYMQNNGTPIGNFFTALIVGFVLSFVILPTLVATSSVGWMQIAAFFSGLCGTLLMRALLDILSNPQLRSTLVKVGVGLAIAAIGAVAEYLRRNMGVGL